jgi:CDP-diacylglycerol--glycerol-3-phosphate 3-phosphatidyltransferase
VSIWGKLYDPFCDAFSHLLIYIGLLLIFPEKIFAVIIGIILFREMYMSLTRAWCAHKGIIVGAQMYGKIKTVTQVVSIYALILLKLSLLIGVSLEMTIWLDNLAKLSLGIALVMTVLSLLMYQLHISSDLE